MKPTKRYQGNRLEPVSEKEYKNFWAKLNPKKLQLHFWVRDDGATCSFTRDADGNVLCSQTHERNHPRGMYIPEEFYIHRKILKQAEKLNLLRKPARGKK